MGEKSYQGDQPQGRLKAIRTVARGHRKTVAVLAIVTLGVGVWAASAGAAADDPRQTTIQSQTSSKGRSSVTTEFKNPDDKQQKPLTKESVQDDGNGTTTEVDVNGESIAVPENGTYRRTTDTGDGTTDIKVESRNQTSSSGNGASNSSSSKLEVNVQSNSSSGQ